MKAFLGLTLYMGIIHKPKIDDYWTKSSLFGTPGIVQIMSNDHYRQLLRNVCFYSSNDILNLDDPIYKIRSLVSQIVFVSQKLYSPGQFLTIDEGMIKFNGRRKLKVYMPLKSIKFDFKV